MKTYRFLGIFTFLILLISNSINAQTYTLKFKTNYGNFEAILYDFTPNHRDLILKEINKGTYKKSQFNRVIKDFVIQGGELDEPILERESQSPHLTPIRLAPEFHPKAFHKMGALGAGRDDNSKKGSYYNQIYFVVGKKITEKDLAELQAKKGYSYTAEQRVEYLKNGGLPRLDNDYTVFGEITKGLKVAIKISEIESNENNLPKKPVIFSIKVKKKQPKKFNRTSISFGAGFTN